MTDNIGRRQLLCISTYEKGQAFLKEAARLGCAVTLLTVDALWNAPWPKDVLAGFEVMPSDLPPHAVLPFVTRLAKHRRFERVVALDEFDLETAALVREHLRLPGMGLTTTRNFRDKLAMREAAHRGGVRVPEFCAVANHDEAWRWMQATPGPWLLKPRASASAIGIQKVRHADDLWPLLEGLGDAGSDHLLERFVPGDIFHVEGVSWQGKVRFALAHGYGQPPMETMHQGGIFTTRTLPRQSEQAAALLGMHEQTLRALGMQNGVTHSEFIRAHEDGQLRFLETGARVGGAYIAEAVELASGINPWVEWARIEVAQLNGEAYALPPLREDYAGSVISLARQDWPDTSAYTDPEIAFRLHKHHHAGLIVRSNDPARVEQLVAEYTQRFLHDFHARLDAPAKPTA